MDENQDIVFLMQIGDSYPFKNLMKLIVDECGTVPMTISESTVSISILNNLKCALHTVTIDTSKLFKYIYNIRNTEGKLLPEYTLSFDAKKILQISKKFNKKDTIEIFWELNNKNLSIKLIESDAKTNNKFLCFYIPLINTENINYEVKPKSDSLEYDNNANVKIYTSNFASYCSQNNAFGNDKLILNGGQDSISFESSFSNDRVQFFSGHVDKSGVVSQNKTIFSRDHPEIITVRIPASTYKALSKIHNISNEPNKSITSFYFKKGLPIKMEIPIGSYGRYICYLRDYKN